ncbi:MAG TPA: SlyX family protein [Pseudomonadales bacterium]|nr:SlyX family protein [Pseudomonadales bacterium]
MESRLTELEIKVAFQDDLLEGLNQIIAQQQRQIDELEQRVQQLLEHILSQPLQGGDSSIKHEIPPHY